MNAKFEKWFKSDCPDYSVEGDSGDPYYYARDAWQAAIQSLEVTDELVNIAFDAYRLKCVKDAWPWLERPAMKEAINAVLSALKEQAK